MAIGTPVAAAAAYSASGGTSVTPAYPSGILVTDEVLLIVGQKPSTANGGTVTTPAGWTLRDELTAAGGYGATLGIDTGNTNLRVYSWNTPVAGQTGNLTVTVGTNGVCWAFIVRVPTGDGAVSFGSADGQQTTTPTSPLSVALTNGTTATNFQAGDLAFWAMCVPTDAGGGATFSAHTISATGATFGATSELNEPSSATGQDIGGVSVWASVTAGSSTTAPTIGATLTGTLTNIRGPVVLLRIRETTQTLTQGTRFTNTPDFFGPTAQATNSVTPALFTNTPQFFSPTVSLVTDQTLTQNTRFTNTPQFFAATSASPVTLSQIAFGPSNSFKYSEQLNVTASGWSIGGGVTVTADTTTAPDGTTTADSINYVTSSTDFRFVRILASIRPGQYYTASIYVKKNNYRYFGIRPMNLGPGFGTTQEECVFDFDTESFVYTPPTSGVVSTGFVNVGGGWYRIYATAQIPFNLGGARVAGFALTDASGFEQGNTLPAGASVYAWGAQLELSTAPSTYVQTVATAPLQQQVPNVFFSPTVSQTGATQNLTPALYTNTPQFFSATATATNTLTPALYTNTPVVYQPARLDLTLTQGALYTNSPTVYQPSRLDLTLTQGALYTNTPQFFAPQVNQTLFPALYINSPTVYQPTVAGIPSVLISWFEVEAQVALILTQTSTFVNSQVYFAPQLNLTLTQNTTFVNSPTVFNPVVGTVLAPALFTNTPTFFAPQLNLTLTQNATYTNSPSVFNPAIGQVLSPALFINTPTVYGPTRLDLQLTQTTRYTNSPTVYNPIRLDLQLTQTARYTNTPAVYNPTRLDQQLTQAATYVNAPTVYAPSVVVSQTLTQIATYVNAPTVYAPTVSIGQTLTQTARYTNTPQFFTATATSTYVLSCQDYVDPGYVDPGYVEFIAFNNNIFYPPTVALSAVVEVSGVLATGLVGDLSVSVTAIVQPTGVVGTGQTGTVVIEIGVPVTGVQAQGQVGTVGFSGGATAFLTGIEALGLVGYVNIWGLVSNGQTPIWQLINDTQVPGTWTPVADTQSAGWQVIDVVQDPSWETVG